MRVKEISVNGLFGTFNHTIPLTNPDRITILHGPNGFGKTVMLKLIASLIDDDLSIFEQIPFTTLCIRLDDDQVWSLRKKQTNDGRPKFTVAVEKDGKSLNGELEIPKVPENLLDEIDQFVPGPYRRFQSGWINDTNNRFHSLREIIRLFPHVESKVPKKYVKGIMPIVTSDLEVFFIETERLEPEKIGRYSTRRDHYQRRSYQVEEESVNEQYLSRVHQYSHDIVRRIKSALADYAKHSQESDRTFPERLVRFMRDNESVLPERQILERMAELERKRQRLISLGFIDSESGLRDLREDDVRRAREALTIYIGDVQEKLAVFDDLAQRVGKLIDIVNERFKYKNIVLHREQGFQVITGSGNNIDLESLSSGEKHELVVLYELLFRAPRNGLVLVDEPEISLHVGWQSKFLEDLMGILKLTGSYGIVATHSPVIIGSRWDLTKELKGPYGAAPEDVE